MLVRLLTNTKEHAVGFHAQLPADLFLLLELDFLLVLLFMLEIFSGLAVARSFLFFSFLVVI